MLFLVLLTIGAPAQFVNDFARLSPHSFKMGLSISKLLSGLFGKKEMRILMVGLVRLSPLLFLPPAAHLLLQLILPTHRRGIPRAWKSVSNGSVSHVMLRGNKPHRWRDALYDIGGRREGRRCALVMDNAGKLIFSATDSNFFGAT